MRYLLALDDTDNRASRGTGFRGRQLARWLRWCGLARVHCITRHQLASHQDIPRTSKNSSVCLEIEIPDGGETTLWQAARRAVRSVAADGSSPGICLALRAAVTGKIMEYGFRCQREVVHLSEAIEKANAGIQLSSVVEGHQANGRIGALAAVGLRASGEDGRVIWSPGLRSLDGIMSVKDIIDEYPLGGAVSATGVRVAHEDRIQLTGWLRPLIRGDQAWLMVERAREGANYEWKLMDRDAVRKIDQ